MNHAIDSTLVSRVSAAIAAAPDADAAMAMAVTILAGEVPTYNWVGIYLLEGNELVLGPFVGKPSPTRASRSAAASAVPPPPSR